MKTKNTKEFFVNDLEQEMLCLATAYLDLYLEDENNLRDNEIYELYDFCRKELYYTVCRQDIKKAFDLTDKASAKVQLATHLLGEDLEVNALHFSIQCCFILVENNTFKLSKGMKLKRLANSINNKILENVGFSNAVENSINIIGKILQKQ